MNRRKGYLLVEMLVVIMTVPIVSFVLAGLFSTIISDVPRTSRVLEENIVLLDMLQQMQKDIDRAQGLPESHAGYIAGDKLLLIKLADGMVFYELKDGKVRRCELTDEGEPDSENAGVWPVPNARINWRIRRENGKASAVEVDTYIEYKLRGRCEKKMANSHLYFVGLFEKL